MTLRLLKIVLSTAVVLYFCVLTTLYLAQRKHTYFPNVGKVAPAAVGLPQAERLHLRNGDGESLLAWFIAPRQDAPLIVYFHGNGGGVGDIAGRLRAFADSGFGVLALKYRGYGGSTGTPSEAGLRLDGEAAYREAITRVARQRIVLLGESLGSGVAVGVAATHEIGALVLNSPYSSVTDVAAARYPIFPVRWLLKDRFESDRLIGDVHAPLLIVHGTADPVVPYRFGRKLFDLANAPKTFLTVEGAGHLAMAQRLPETIAWLRETLRR